jgi:hypothetical protein
MTKYVTPATGTGVSEAWVIRPFEADDENCIASMWLKSYARSHDIAGWLGARGYDTEQAQRWFLRTTPAEEREQERYYWRFFQPMVTALIRGCETRVLLDSSRVHTTPEAPSGIWAWACVSPGLVHYVAVKQEVMRQSVDGDLVAEMLCDLLGDRLDEPQVTTFEQRELSRMGLLPPSWMHDRSWLDHLRRLGVWVRKQPACMRLATSEVLRSFSAWTPKEAA